VWPILQTGVPDDIFERLLGPQSLVVGAIILTVILYREWRQSRAAHIASMEREIASRDVRIADLTKERDVALEGWRAQTDATNRIADTLEEDRRDRASRRRLADT